MFLGLNSSTEVRSQRIYLELYNLQRHFPLLACPNVTNQVVGATYNGSTWLLAGQWRYAWINVLCIEGPVILSQGRSAGRRLNLSARRFCLVAANLFMKALKRLNGEWISK
jgi:hypothetical protein